MMSCKAINIALTSRHLYSSRKFSTASHLYRNRKDVQLKDSYYHSTSTVPLLAKTVGKCLDETVEKFPNREAFIFCQDNVRKTFTDLKNETNRLAAGFVAVGIEKGDRVGMWGPNVWEWILTQYATARIGAIQVNINPAYRTQELEYSLNQVGVKAIVSSQTFKTQDYYGMITEACPELKNATAGNLKSQRIPSLRTVIMIGSGQLKGSFMFDDVMEMGKEEHVNDVMRISDELQFDDAINIQFTSGTTGFPKGATLTHHNITNNMDIIGRHLGYHKKHHTICVPVPLYHTFGMVGGSMSSIVHGTTCVFPSPSYEAEPTLKAVHDERCTSQYGTPVMFIDMLHHPNFDKYDLTSLSTGVMAAAPCPAETMKQVIDRMHMKDILIGYGLTETSPVITLNYVDDDMERRVSTVGRAVDHLEVKIVDPQSHKVVPVNDVGELCTRGHSVMKYYWNAEEKTRDTIDETKWLHTGDLGTMDERGYCRIVGRLKDTIIRGGENIFPTEIEQHLYKHPKVEDVQVIGLPDERLGEEVCACIKLRAGETATPDEIKDFCKGQIAHYKIPRYVEFVEAFPMTVTLKVQKYIMRDNIAKKLGLINK